MCFAWLSEKTVPFDLYIINRSVFVTEVEDVYYAVRRESLYSTDTFRPKRFNIQLPVVLYFGG
jgi:hypothetical protein